MTPEELRKKFGIDKAYVQIDRNHAEYIVWLEEQVISYHEALQFAGKLAISAEKVRYSRVGFVSDYIKEMGDALDEYDKHILEIHEGKPTP